jgi:hypothetical protein
MTPLEVRARDQRSRANSQKKKHYYFYSFLYFTLFTLFPLLHTFHTHSFLHTLTPSHLHIRPLSIPRLPRPPILQMGVRGLAKILKETGGTLAYGLKSKHAHVDFLSMFFPLVQAQTFCVTSSTIAKEVRALACTETTPSASAPSAPSAPSTPPAPPASSVPSATSAASPYATAMNYPIEVGASRKRRATTPVDPSPKRRKVVLDDISINTQHPTLFIGTDGHITQNPPEQKQVWQLGCFKSGCR